MSNKRLEINPVCGERVKQLCRRMGITQKELAGRINYSPQLISKIVRGKSPLSSYVADAIIKIFPGVSKEWLMGATDVGMDRFEDYYLYFKDSKKKEHAFEGLLSVINDYDIDFNNPFEISDGIHNEKFYNIAFYDSNMDNDKHIAISKSQMDALIETVLEMTELYLQKLVKYGKTAQQISDEYSEYAAWYVNEITDTLFEADEEGEGVVKQEERNIINNFKNYLLENMGCRDGQSFAPTNGDFEKRLSQKYDDKYSK